MATRALDYELPKATSPTATASKYRLSSRRPGSSSDNRSCKNYVFVYAPGASGHESSKGKELRPTYWLAQLGSVVKVTGMLGMQGCTPRNLAIFQDAVVKAKAIAEPDGRVVLVGSSFGARMCVHFVSGVSEVRKPPNEPTPWLNARWTQQELSKFVDCAILLGYPLFHKKQNRARALTTIPVWLHILSISGDRDSIGLGPTCDVSAVERGFSARVPTTNSSSNNVTTSAAAVEFHVVPGGKHNPLESIPTSEAASVRANTVARIKGFLRANVIRDDDN